LERTYATRSAFILQTNSKSYAIASMIARAARDSSNNGNTNGIRLIAL
jgi:hypothetical protein